MEVLSFVGKSVPRKDGVEKATGRALYTVDMVLPGMLWGKILRSPYPHAKILNIDTSRAERLPGVKAVITGKDTLGIKHGFVETPRYPPDQYTIAMDRVRYIGEEVAAVAAIDEYVANHNTKPKPFIWTKSAADILQKVIRANSRLSSKQNATLH